MNSCYTNLNIKLYPFKRPVEELLSDNWPAERMDKLHNIEDLNPEILDLFQKNNVIIRNTFLIINWWVHRPRPAHTDGNWFSPDEIVAKRRCGINWNFTPGTWVEFYSMENAVPTFNPSGRIDDATTWSNANTIIDKWDTLGPVIFNPQMIHRVNGFPYIQRRISCTLRFEETYESLSDKLSIYIK